MGDQALWERLKGYTVNFVHTTVVDLNNTQNPKPISLIHATRALSTGNVTNFQDMLEHGTELYLITVNQETSYIGRELYYVFREVLTHLDKLRVEQQLPPKATLVSLEDSKCININGKKKRQRTQSNS